MDPHHGEIGRGGGADERGVLGPCAQVTEADHPEVAVSGGQRRLRDALDARPGGGALGHGCVVVRAAPGDEVRDRHHDEVVLRGEGRGVVEPHHRAVVVDEFGDAGHLAHSGQAAQVHGCLGVPGPVQHAAGHGTQGQHVAGPDEALGAGARIGEHTEGVRAVRGGDAGADAVCGVDGHGVRRPPRVLAVRDHERQVERVGAGGGHRGAQVARGVPDGPGDPLRRRGGGGEDDVRLVLPVRGVDGEHGPALAQGLERVLDRAGHGRGWAAVRHGALLPGGVRRTWRGHPPRG